MITGQTASAIRELHPSRVARAIFSDRNPLMPAIRAAADAASRSRQKVAQDSPLRRIERLGADGVAQALDLWRDWRDAAWETGFLAIYGNPFLHWFGATHAHQRTRMDPVELRFLPQVQAVLKGVDTGGYAAAVIRMLILLAESRGSVRRDRLERSAQVLATREPFASLGPERRAELIHEQSVIVEFEPEPALQALPGLLPTRRERLDAIGTVHFVVGDRGDMEPHSLAMLERMEQLLRVGADPGAARSSRPRRGVATRREAER